MPKGDDICVESLERIKRSRHASAILPEGMELGSGASAHPGDGFDSPRTMGASPAGASTRAPVSERRRSAHPTWSLWLCVRTTASMSFIVRRHDLRGAHDADRRDVA